MKLTSGGRRGAALEERELWLGTFSDYGDHVGEFGHDAFEPVGAVGVETDGGPEFGVGALDETDVGRASQLGAADVGFAAFLGDGERVVGDIEVDTAGEDALVGAGAMGHHDDVDVGHLGDDVVAIPVAKLGGDGGGVFVLRSSVDEDARFWGFDFLAHNFSILMQ